MFERRQFGTSRRRVIFFVCGYQTKINMYRPVYWVMRRLGYRVYAYVLDPKTVTTSHITGYVKQIKAVQRDIAGVLKSLPADMPAYVMGNSLGSESALYALKHTPQLRAAALVTTRGSIAEFIWNTPAGKVYKTVYEENNYTFAQLSRELAPAEPTKDIELLGDRPVCVYYSTPDVIIPASNTELLIEALDAARSNYRVKHYAWGGHFASTFKGLGAFWRWHRFFRQA